MNKDWVKEAVAAIGERCIRFKDPKRIIDEGLAEKIILIHVAPILAENERLKKRIKKLEEERNVLVDNINFIYK